MIAYIVSKVNESILSLHDTTIASKFPNVFLDNLPRLAPEKEVECNIKLALKTMSISKAL